jgi:hypothetical protein
MRITDDRLDELVEDFVNGCFSDHAVPAVLLALTELQDRRDDEYDDANDNYETALDIVQAAHPDEDYSWARDADDDDEDYTNPEVDYDVQEDYLGDLDDNHFVPPWDFDPDVGDDDDDTF